MKKVKIKTKVESKPSWLVDDSLDTVFDGSRIFQQDTIEFAKNFSWCRLSQKVFTTIFLSLLLWHLYFPVTVS